MKKLRLSVVKSLPEITQLRNGAWDLEYVWSDSREPQPPFLGPESRVARQLQGPRLRDLGLEERLGGSGSL